jgi:hypothetical protein
MKIFLDPYFLYRKGCIKPKTSSCYCPFKPRQDLIISEYVKKTDYRKCLQSCSVWQKTFAVGIALFLSFGGLSNASDGNHLAS